MNAQEIACQQAFTSGDLTYYNAAGCSRASENQQLISQAKKLVSNKTIYIVGGGVLVTGLLIFLSVKK